MISVGCKYVDPLRFVCSKMVFVFSELNRSTVPSIDWFPNVLKRFESRMTQIYVHS